jgi:hypothetical protein
MTLIYHAAVVMSGPEQGHLPSAWLTALLGSLNICPAQKHRAPL